MEDKGMGARGNRLIVNEKGEFAAPVNLMTAMNGSFLPPLPMNDDEADTFVF